MVFFFPSIKINTPYRPFRQLLCISSAEAHNDMYGLDAHLHTIAHMCLAYIMEIIRTTMRGIICRCCPFTNYCWDVPFAGISAIVHMFKGLWFVMSTISTSKWAFINFCVWRIILPSTLWFQINKTLCSNTCQMCWWVTTFGSTCIHFF